MADWPGQKLFLFQLGDNGLEEVFSSVRTLTHQRNVDIVELGHKLSIIGQLHDIYSRHPDWYKQSKHLSPNDDRDRPRAVLDQEGRVVDATFDLLSCWNDGRIAAAEAIASSGLFPGNNPAALWFTQLDTRAMSDKDGMTSLLRPEGQPVGVVALSDEGDALPTQPAEMRATEDGLLPNTTDPFIPTSWDEARSDLDDTQEHCWVKFEEGSDERIHKSTLVRQLFSRQQGSTDRVRRVMGSSKWGRWQRERMSGSAPSDDGALCIGDPVAVLVKAAGTTAALAIIEVTKLTCGAAAPVFTLPPAQASDTKATICGKVLCLQQQVRDGEEGPSNDDTGTSAWQWDGTYAGAVTVQGDIALVVDPVMQPPHSPQCSFDVTIHFEHSDLAALMERVKLVAAPSDATAGAIAAKRQLPQVVDRPDGSATGFPYGPFAEADALSGSSHEFKCLVCEQRGKDKSISKTGMRAHIAAHILKGHIDESSCGFCGMPTCVPQLVQGAGGTRAAPRWQVSAKSCARYWVKVKYQSALNPAKPKSCSNVPVQCSECPTVLWKYAVKAHWSEKHAGVALPAELLIGDAEKKAIKAMVV